MCSDPVDPPATQAPPSRRAYCWGLYRTFPDTMFGLNGAGLFTLAVHASDGRPSCKFVVDRLTFQRHSSVFNTIFSGGQPQLDQTSLKLVIAQDGTDVVELQSDGDFAQGLRLVIRAIYDPLFLVKELPDRLGAMGQIVNPNSPRVDWELITDLRAILDVATTFNFVTIKQAVIETLTHHAFSSSATLSQLCARMRSAPEVVHTMYYGHSVSLADCRVYLQRFLSLAHDYKVYSMIPGIYYLLLALHGPTALSAAKSIPASDRLRCSSAYFSLFHLVKDWSKPNTATDVHKLLLQFSSLRNDEQARIWDALPATFKLGSWDDLRKGKLSDAVEA